MKAKVLKFCNLDILVFMANNSRTVDLLQFDLNFEQQRQTYIHKHYCCFFSFCILCTLLFYYDELYASTVTKLNVILKYKDIYFGIYFAV